MSYVCVFIPVNVLASTALGPCGLKQQKTITANGKAEAGLLVLRQL